MDYRVDRLRDYDDDDDDDDDSDNDDDDDDHDDTAVDGAYVALPVLATCPFTPRQQLASKLVINAR